MRLLPLVLSLVGCADSTAVLVTLDGRVESFTGQSGIPGATVRFEDYAGVVTSEATTDEFGDYRATMILPYDPQTGAEVFAAIDVADFVPTSAHELIRMSDWRDAQAAGLPGRTARARVYALQPYELARQSDVDGAVSGLVFDAVSPDQSVGIPNLDIAFREGIDAPDTTPVTATTTTAADGTYSVVGLLPGTYTATITGSSGWSDAKFDVVCVGGQTTRNQNGATSQALLGDEFRVVLSWGETPADLDSHLSGPLTDGVADTNPTSRFHVFYADKSYPDAPADGSGATVFLDVDDTSSFGPETVTVRHVAKGTYRYTVHDYTNRASTSSSAMSLSRAKVQVFLGDGTSQTFAIPSSIFGTTWRVFELDGKTQTPYLVSDFGYASDPTSADAFIY